MVRTEYFAHLRQATIAAEGYTHELVYGLILAIEFVGWCVLRLELYHNREGGYSG